MISFFSIGTMFALGLSLRGRERELTDNEVTPAVRKLRQLLNARIQGSDNSLRIEGAYAETDVAVVVDGARGESRLTVEVPSPRGISFWIAPRINSNKKEGEALTSWAHPTKALYSDDVLLTGSLVSDVSISTTLSRLAADPHFSLVLRDGVLKVTGKVQPDRLSDQFVPELVKDMTRLVRTLDTAPEVKRRVVDQTARTKQQRNLFIGAAGVAVLMFCTLLVYADQRAHRPSSWLRPVAIEGWRPLEATDIDKESAAIEQQHEQATSDRIDGDFTGRGAMSGEAAILVRESSDDAEDGKYRVVIQTDPASHFERSYQTFAFALKVSNRNLHKIRWVGDKPPALSPREAVLVVQDRSDVRSGELLLFDGQQIRVFQPEDYRVF